MIIIIIYFIDPDRGDIHYFSVLSISGAAGGNDVSLYFKVDNIRGSKNLITYDVGAYFIDETGEKKFIEKVFSNLEDTLIDFSFVPDLEGENFIKQAYENLKTIPEFKDAQDDI